MHSIDLAKSVKYQWYVSSLTGDKSMTLLKKRPLSAPARQVVGAASRRRLPRVSLRDRAYEAIKERIITCQFQPGECINEASVSALLGLGRTPVHQAIDRLMLEDMVDVIPRKGVIVKPVILQDVMQMIEVRMVNETQCARLAATRAEQGHVEQMSAVLGKARRAIDKQDVHSLMELDREFHLLLASASKNSELAEIIRRLNERSLRFWFISFTTPDHHHSFQRQHEALFEAVRKHDADAAEGAMRVHIEAFRKSVARHL